MRYILVISLLALALTACGERAAPGTFRSLRPTIAPASVPAPKQEIYSVSEVLMKHRGGDDYEFAGAASPHYTASELMKVVYCRAATEARKLGYQNWYPQMSYNQLTKVEGPRIAGSIITYTRGPLPKGASDRESKTEWCGK